MAAHAARLAAYAELVAGLLDVRDVGAAERFDAHVERLVGQGLLDPEAARSIRLLQRQAVSAVVEHAQAVLPATLIALEESHSQQWLAGVDGISDIAAPNINEPDNTESDNTESDNTESDNIAADPQAAYETHDVGDEISDDTAAETAPVDLTARRLLVAGLTLLPDP